MTTDNFEMKSVAGKKDAASAASFLNSVLSHEVSDEIWEWEFNTFPEHVVLTIIKDKEETIGTQFMLPVKLCAGNKEVLSGKCENSFFNDNYRGQGLFKNLFYYAEDLCLKKSYGLLWAFTGAVKVYENTLGFTAFRSIMYNFSITVGKPRFNAIRQRERKPVKAGARYAWYLLKHFAFRLKCRRFASEAKYKQLAHKYTVRDNVTSFSQLDDLYSSLKSMHGDFAHIKIDKPFLDWRITNNVNLKHCTKYFYENEKLAGYYIFSLNDSSAHLCDFTPANEEAAAFMMCSLLQEVKRLRTSALTYFGNMENKINKSIFDLLLSLGGNAFVNEGMPFVYKTIPVPGVNEQLLGSSKNWYLNGMWTEGIAY